MYIKRLSLDKEQGGMASILVTMVLMLIIGLIVIGLARVSRREQQQSLDDQLSTQAFYAAESGVNDAIDVLKKGLDDDYTTDCKAFISAFSLNPKLDESTGVEYTCLLVNRAPGNLTYNDISTEGSTVVVVKPQSGNINSMTISWQKSPSADTTDPFCSPVGKFTPAAAWPCKTGIVRADILPGTGGNRKKLSDDVMTAFLYPSGVGAANSRNPLSYNPADTGAISGGQCSAGKCSVKINFSGGQPQVFLRLKSIYVSSSVTITANDGAAKLIGAQAVIDATGKANDVLRRIQVRVPLAANQGPFPEFAIQSGTTICKQLEIAKDTGIVSNMAPAGLIYQSCNPFN